MLWVTVLAIVITAPIIDALGFALWIVSKVLGLAEWIFTNGLPLALSYGIARVIVDALHAAYPIWW
jgi:hypothetical protein